MVEQRGELRPLLFMCSFTHTVQVAQLAGPALSPGRGRLSCIYRVRGASWYSVDLALKPTVLLEIITNSLLTLCVARFVFIPGGLTGRILNSSPLVPIGRLSYSLYLWQQLFLRPDGIAPVPLPMPFSRLATFSAASACYAGVEVRFPGLREKLRHGPVSESLTCPVTS